MGKKNSEDIEVSDVPKKETYLTKLKGIAKDVHYQKVKDGVARFKEKRKELLAKAELEAQKLLPQLIAQRIIEETSGENFNPSLETIMKLRSMINSGVSLKDMRRKFFAEVDQKTWDKLTRYMFKDAVPNTEVLGIDIFKAREDYIKTLKSRIRAYKKQKRICELMEKPVPPSIMSGIAVAEDKLFEINMETANTMHNLGVVGDKAKAATIHIHTTVPRPKPVEDAIDVTKTSLSSMLGK